MRFVSKYAKYMFNVRSPITEHYATGQSKVIQSALVAVFDIALVNGDERALARQHFSFNGFAQEQDLVTVVEPDARISAFDSRLAQAEHGWTDEERELVESELIENAKRLPEDLIVVEEIRLDPPWPSYDRFGGTAKQLADKIEEDGYDFAEVLAYERENQNRPEVVTVLEHALDLVADGLMVREVLHEPEEELVG
jgi:hypothetical protein